MTNENHVLSPRLIDVVYSYMKSQYVIGDTLESIERTLGIDIELVSKTLQLLEEEGYLTTSRGSLFQCMVVK